jgi:CDP-glycerol glycerophosphotransferase
LRHAIIDLLAHDSLLPLRDRVRDGLGWAQGVRLRTSRGVRSEAGLLSVVVPAYGVEAYIEECLSSLRRQNYRNVEIIVVDDGSPDRSGEIARRLAKRDPRIVVIRQENGGLSSARNTGAANARGEYLTFIDSDDVVDRHVFTQAIESLRATGSDFAVSPYRRKYRNGFPPAAPWIHAAHARDRFACTLEEFPEIQVNAVAWSKVYRRAFWDASELAFPVGVLYEDQAVSARAYAMARSFDVLSTVSINWRMREDQTSISQQVTSVRNITDHWGAVRASLDVLAEYGHAEARRARLAQIISNNLTEFFMLIREMSDEAWAVFAASVQYLVDQIDLDSVWDEIDARSKLLTHIVAAGDRKAALRFLERDGWRREFYHAELRGDALYAHPDAADGIIAGPESAFKLSPRESALVAEVAHARRLEDGIELGIIAYIDGHDPHAAELLAAVELVPDRGEIGLPVASEWVHAPAELASRSTPYVDRSSQMLRVFVPFDRLADHPEDYRLRLTLRSDALVRTGLATRPSPHPSFASTTLATGLRLDLVTGHGDDAVLRTGRASASVISWATDGSRATIGLSGGTFQRVALVSPMDRFGRRRREARVERRDGVQRATLRIGRPMPATGHGPGDWYVTAQDEHGAWHWVEVDDTAGVEGHGLTGLRTQTRTASGVAVPAATATVHRRETNCFSGVSLADDVLVLSTEDRPDGDFAAVSGSRRVPVARTPGENALTLPLTIDEFGRAAMPLPRGVYRITSAGRDTAIDEGLRLRLPIALLTGTQQITVRADDWNTLVVDIDVARPVQDRGPGSIERLRLEALTAAGESERPMVLFRCLYSESANDTALALHERLRERGADLELVWAARDHSTAVPEGGRRVIENSREYFEAFVRADYVVVNVHQPDWFEKRDGQVVIETFHGYPFKANGAAWWRRLGFPPERIESFHRRAAEWDYLVSPAPYATPYLLEFFRDRDPAETEILEIGYPRNDALLDASAAERRSRARRALGLADGDFAVLYAPTFRDYLSADDMSATASEFLDTDALTRKLGSGYRVLTRGHPFNARGAAESAGSAIDVTNHPDINDLILASDAGILDYSSLRFDYALTDKPMIFFTPDEERYFAERPGFFDYAPTAPGPRATTTDAVVDLLRDPDRLGAEWAAARAQFRSSFTPLDDGNAADRLIDRVFVPRGDAPPLADPPSAAR